jgi:hypothetical protein
MSADNSALGAELELLASDSVTTDHGGGKIVLTACFGVRNSG